MAVRLGIDGVVMIACIFRIDGDQRDGGEVFAWRLRRAGLLCFLDHGFRELVRHAMRVHGDQRGRAWIVDMSQNVGDTGAARAVSTRGARLDTHEIAIAGITRIATLDDELGLLFAGRRLNCATIAVGAINTDQ